MREINETKIHELLQNMDENNQKEIEELGASILKTQGNMDLSVDDYLKMKCLFEKNYYSRECKDFPLWCLVVSGYLIKYQEYGTAMEILEMALLDAQLRYYTDLQNVSVLEIYLTVLFHIAEHYFKERLDFIYAALYYAKLYELLISQSKEIRNKMGNYDQWLDDVFEKIELLMEMAEDNQLIDMRMLTSMLNSIVTYRIEE